MGQIISYYENQPTVINEKENTESKVIKDNQEITVPYIKETKETNDTKDKAKKILDNIIEDVVKKQELEKKRKITKIAKEYVDNIIKETIDGMKEENENNYIDEVDNDSDSDDSLHYSNDDLSLSIKEEVEGELSAANTKIRRLNYLIENLNDEYDNLFLKHCRLKIKYESLLCKKKN